MSEPSPTPRVGCRQTGPRPSPDTIIPECSFAYTRGTTSPSSSTRKALPAGAALPGRTHRRANASRSRTRSRSTISSPGEPVLRYGQTIGYANRAIPAGSWVREELLDMPAAPPLDELPLATAVPAAAAAARRLHLRGLPQCRRQRRHAEHARHRDHRPVRRADGGLRRRAAFAPRLLPRFPNVDDVVPDHALLRLRRRHRRARRGRSDPHAAAHLAARQSRRRRRWSSAWAARNCSPRGCSANELARCSARPNVIRLQDQRGFAETVAAIMRAAEKRLAQLDRRRRADLPRLGPGGRAAMRRQRRLLRRHLQSRRRATRPTCWCAPAPPCMFSEVTEVRDAIHLLTPRAATPEVARDLIREMRWYDEYLARGDADRSANTTPGNKRGGLANIVEKALGSVAKAGSTRDPRGRGATARRSPRRAWSSPPRPPAISSAARSSSRR